MSHDFTAASEPVTFAMGMTVIDPDAIKRYFPPANSSIQFRTSPPTHSCPECGEMVDGGLVKDITVTPGARPDTYEIRGESVTYTPCGHEVRWQATDDEEGEPSDHQPR